MTLPCPQPSSAFFQSDKEQEQSRAGPHWDAMPHQDMEAILQAKESPQNKSICAIKHLAAALLRACKIQIAVLALQRQRKERQAQGPWEKTFKPA